MKKTVYDRLKSLVGLQGEKVLLLGDYSRGVFYGNVDWGMTFGYGWVISVPDLGGLRQVDPREGQG